MSNRSLKFPAVLAAMLLMATVSLPPCAVGADVPTVNWSQLSPASSFTPRSYAAVAYDAVSRKIVVFGGFNTTGYLNDTWTFDGTTWTQVQIATAPTLKECTTVAIDSISTWTRDHPGWGFERIECQRDDQ